MECILLLPRPDQPGGKNREYEQNSVEATNNHESGLFETTFGVDGEVETYTSEKPVSTNLIPNNEFTCYFLQLLYSHKQLGDENI